MVFSRILVTVPSNAGADLITEQLASTCLFKPGDFVRLNGFLRADLTVPETIADFCVDGTHLDSVAKHRLIICTVATAGQFFQLNLNTGHFSHVFIDEAGYCTEPEALIPSVLAAISKEAVVSCSATMTMIYSVCADQGFCVIKLTFITFYRWFLQEIHSS